MNGVAEVLAAIGAVCVARSALSGLTQAGVRLAVWREMRRARRRLGPDRADFNRLYLDLHERGLRHYFSGASWTASEVEEWNYDIARLAAFG